MSADVTNPIPLLAAVVCILGPWVAACNSAAPNAASEASAVVGGASETRFPAVGYLLTGSSPASFAGPECGVTLIAPRVAVTAAHCVIGSRQGAANPNLVFGVSFGAVGAVVQYIARVAVAHPQYSPLGAPRYAHDVAVLLFDEDVRGIKPASVVATREGANALYVGYGRTTFGDQTITTGYTNERKSAGQRVTRLASSSIYVTGTNGGLCWGDSGGPLLDPSTGAISGVLADFGVVPSTCSVADTMVFTDLSAEKGFLDGAIRCSVAKDPAACLATTIPKFACHFACADFSYIEGKCVADSGVSWACENTCITQVVSCTDVECRFSCAQYQYAEHECHESGGKSWVCERGCILSVASCGT